ncbi:unnamed protein product [Lymnaea stagnalis]|uniref:Uncharacterized protein n=1 Tax=Lymnaea stagnalis TaxID=6523 RepID=A0AAV2I583_LYMST
MSGWVRVHGRRSRSFKSKVSSRCRGRGGRGRRRGNLTFSGRNRSVANESSQNHESFGNERIEYNFNTDPKVFFTGAASTEQHLAAQNENRLRYAATLAVLITNKIQVKQNACIKALAMAWARGDDELATAFLKLKSNFGLVEVLKALNMLDAGRQVRTLEKRLKCLELSTTKVKPQKISKLKMDINNLNKVKPPLGSASGAVCKHVAKWVREFTAADLEFFAINFPKDPWKKLADICHLKPEKDFPAAPWFLAFCFGTGSPPIGSNVEYCQQLTMENVNDLIKEHDIPFSVVKPFKEKLSPESKQRISECEAKLDIVLWWYEDLSCPGTDEVISKRLAAGETISLPNGKLLERLLTILLLRNPQLARRGYDDMNYEGEPEGETNFFTQLMDLAEPKLTSIRLNLESPIVIMGDASGSMEVAIRTSTIIASLLTAICSAKLVFFNTETRDAPFLPKTVKEMLKLAANTKAVGGTTPAASLLPFYRNKEVVKTFIMVTDEEENGQADGHSFAPLYQKYYKEVYPAHLIFVSFLRGQHAQGQMVKDLNNLGYHPKQLRLEGSRPDLTKLDDLFAQLSAVTTSSFTSQLEEMESHLHTKSVAQLFEEIIESGEYSAASDQGN